MTKENYELYSCKVIKIQIVQKLDRFGYFSLWDHHPHILAKPNLAKSISSDWQVHNVFIKVDENKSIMIDLFGLKR